MSAFHRTALTAVCLLTLPANLALGSTLKIKKANINVAQKVVADYADLAFATYQNSLASARDLQTVVKSFTDKPSEKTLALAKAEWKNARKFYAFTEALRFYGGPIDNAENGPEGLLNAWPLDEAYIDYVKGNAKSGIVQNPETFPTITKELLLSLNEKDGEKNISTGYHAVEFLLWGQDFSTTSAGNRSFKDYDVKTNKFAARRAIYLNLLCDLIVEHLAGVTAQWDPQTKNSYRQAFLKEPLAEALRRIFTGLTSLAVDEMAGERLTVALEINDQENEQDCFSDFSLHDSSFDQIGIDTVLTNNGGDTSLLKLIEMEDPSLAAAVVATSAKIIPLHNEAIKIGSFDKIIANHQEASAGRKKIRELIAALNAQGVALAKAGKAMGLELNIETEGEHLP